MAFRADRHQRIYRPRGFPVGLQYWDCNKLGALEQSSSAPIISSNNNSSYDDNNNNSRRRASFPPKIIPQAKMVGLTDVSWTRTAHVLTNHPSISSIRRPCNSGLVPSTSRLHQTASATTTSAMAEASQHRWPILIAGSGQIERAKRVGVGASAGRLPGASCKQAAAGIAHFQTSAHTDQWRPAS